MTVESAPILGFNNRDVLPDAPKAAIAALLMAAAESNVKVVLILEGRTVAGININLGWGAAVNPGALVASVVIFFPMTTAPFCVIHNRLTDRTFGRTLMSVCSWLATIAAFTSFFLTLVLVPISWVI